MKVLFTLYPMYGHFHPLVPLARCLEAHGHEVAFAVSAGFRQTIESNGFRHFPCGHDHDGSKMIFKRLQELGVIEATARIGPHLFAEVLAPKMAEDCLQIMEHWQADLIFRDPVELGGSIAAEVASIPHVGSAWAYFWPKATQIKWWGAGLAKLRQGYGLAPDPRLEVLDRYMNIHFMPPSWHGRDFPLPANALAFQTPLFDRSGGQTLPDWIETLPEENPNLYVTLGTVLNQAPDTFEAILQGLAHEPINVIVTLGPGLPFSRVKTRAPNIYLAEYIPQSLLLPYCDALIAHGGYNTLLAALMHGLPMVMTPLAARDQPINSRRCHENGVGIWIQEQPPPPNMVRESVWRILKEPEFRAKAESYKYELEMLPSMDEIVAALEVCIRTQS